MHIGRHNLSRLAGAHERARPDRVEMQAHCPSGDSDGAQLFFTPRREGTQPIAGIIEFIAFHRVAMAQ